MIFDKISNYMQYNLHEALQKGFEHSLTVDKDSPNGKLYLNNDDIFAIIAKYTTKNLEDCITESHIKYVDIQIIIDGEETIYWYPEGVLEVNTPYVTENDAFFYKIQNTDPGAILNLKPGYFAIFFPFDIHTTQIKVVNNSQVKKLVYKVPVEKCMV